MGQSRAQKVSTTGRKGDGMNPSYLLTLISLIIRPVENSWTPSLLAMHPTVPESIEPGLSTRKVRV